MATARLAYLQVNLGTIMTLDQLRASLAATNNGYLFAPSAAELACARAHPDAVRLVGTMIYPLDWHAKYGKAWDAMRPLAAPRQVRDEFDYEGAILSRQESAGFYD
jgi:hypothetical protein